MCGFAGFTGIMDKSEMEKTMSCMLEAIKHRGNDASGVYANGEIAMGIRRNTKTGEAAAWDAPMKSPDKNLVVLFDGRLYNGGEKRESLIEAGHVFETDSDTELALHLYMEYGDAMTSHMRGVYAAVVYNTSEKSLFAVRDPFGAKSFNYCVTENGILFGSEIKSLLAHPWFKKELNVDALESYLTFQYSALSESFFKGVFKLPHGHYMRYANGQLFLKRYFSPEFNRAERTLKQTVADIDDVVEESIKAHIAGGGEIGALLSSGVDSSYIAARSGCKKTFTVGFDNEDYNEINYAVRLSQTLGAENVSKVISRDEYFEALPEIQYFLDEPMADAAAVALYFVFDAAKEHVGVVLSGEAADEFFGGYNIYREPLDLKIVTDLPLPIRRFLGRFAAALPFSIKGKNFFIRAGKTVEERFVGNANIFSMNERRQLLKNPRNTLTPQQVTKKYYDRVGEYDDITKMQYLDINMWMVGDILLQGERLSNAHGIEVRMPLLDKKVFAVAASVQTDYRVNRTATKYAFRLAAKSYLPDDVAKKKKLGFPVPIRVWLREDTVYERVLNAFQNSPGAEYFNVLKLESLLREHKRGKRDNSRKIWTVYMFLVWYDQYFTKEGIKNDEKA